MNSFLLAHTPPCTLSLKVLASASKTECFDRLSDGTLKIRVASVREDGRANKELLGYLAKEFSVKKSRVRIISGEMSDRKIVEIL